MRKMETEQTREERSLRETRRDIPFVGPAEVGRGLAELGSFDRARIARRWGSLMNELGYSVD
jgi:hypothetical protein